MKPNKVGMSPYNAYAYAYFWVPNLGACQDPFYKGAVV